MLGQDAHERFPTSGAPPGNQTPPMPERMVVTEATRSEWRLDAELVGRRRAVAEGRGEEHPTRTPQRSRSPPFLRRDAPTTSDALQPRTTVVEFLRAHNFRSAGETDEDGWYPLHHAIQQTAEDQTLFETVIELASGMIPEDTRH